ncbi:MAG: hypothetical protein HKN24_09180 [Acidimicrobiales bacterium]|nr:hypothetical protein [Acidimicrobiales bacterium]
MLVHIGPVGAAQMDGWLRFSRRVLCDLRTEPGDLGRTFAQNLLAEWNKLMDEWAAVLDETMRAGQPDFVWKGDLDPDEGEYLVYSLQRTIRSTTVAAWVSPEDLANHGLITYHVLKRLIDSLESEGVAHHEFVEQMRAEVARFRASFP